MQKFLAHGGIFKVRIIPSIKGQTIVEALVTFVIIAIAAVALIKFQNYLLYDNSLAQQKSEATILAVKETETLRDFQVLNNQSGYTSYQSIASGNTTTTVNNTSYTVTWTVTSNSNPTYKVIDVTTSWTDRYNGAQSIRITTDVAGIDPSYSSSVM